MLRKAFLAIAMSLVVIAACAQSKLTPYTKLFLQHHAEEAAVCTSASANLINKSHSNFVKTKVINGVEMIGSFITVNDDSDIQAIKDLGAVVNARFGNIIAAQVPVDKLESIAQLKHVANVSVAHPLKLKNDSARSVTKVNQVQTLTSGTGLTQAYKGSGVVVGIVDDGIEYNHIAFKDASGVSRVKRVYQPQDNSGNSPTVNGSTLPGTEYTTAAQIAALTTDDAAAAHGTHTTGIAAGAYTGNNYYGMAPEADLVLCGCNSQLSDYNIAMSVIYVFNYAKSVGKPVVVNLSLGDHYGPHDGTSYLSKILDQLSGAGKIVVIAAGNEAGTNLHLYKKFTASSPILQSVLYDTQGYSGMYYFDDYLDFWTRNTDYKTNPAVQFVVIKASNDSVVYTSKVFTSSGSIYASSDSKLNKFYTEGQINVSMGKDGNTGKYEIITEPKGLYAKNGTYDYYIGVKYAADSLTSADVWDAYGYTDFINNGWKEYTAGNDNVSINEFACGNNTISVGAFNSKLRFRTTTGQSYSYNGTVGAVSQFSSYGPDVNGVTRPDVLAPGHCLVSTVNAYDTTSVSDRGYVYCAKATSGSRTDYWGQMSGTSMATPATVGIIALWLQENPELTAADIKDVFKNSCIQDSYVTGSPQKSGFGKINALAGLQYIIKSSGVKGVISRSSSVSLYPNPSDGEFTVCSPDETGNFTMNIYNVGGGLVYSKSFDGSNGTVNVNLGGSVAPGIYIVHINGARTNYSSRLILR
jgi:minor extracellular serine protease Vpr